ncbi:VOC family protein [Sphingomonas panaciterrae]|jgi:catechol 2,3-dioxygenase-like lactoylglutathione lyase family enzyme|uniref:VOC family protein n=1 Tax=Sphingomonas panaciterrae TaxID=1462999 RepID=UPI002FF36AF9
MPVEALDHVQLAMPPGGEDAARRFYAGLLGIPEVPKPAHLAGRSGCWFERGALKIHLGAEQDFRPVRKAHPAFLVTDLDALIASLADAGFTSIEDEPLEGYDRRYVTDPFGNRIELMQPCGAAMMIDDSASGSAE